MKHPEQIGKYKIADLIGTGGFGSVYRAEHPLLKRVVAIKICSAGDEVRLKRFAREAEIVGRFQHPNIIIIHDFGFHDDRPFLVQEYLPGWDLDVAIREKRPIDYATRFDYLQQVAAALAYSHSHNVIHRDIKPSNIRVLEDGRVKVLDFGIARLSTQSGTSLTGIGMTIGTVGYLAPEQIRGEKAGPGADVFSFGVVAYELLTYRRPFRGNSPPSLLHEILMKDPVPVHQYWPQCPPDVEAFLKRCLARNIKDRYPSFDALQPDLEKLAAAADRMVGPTVTEVTGPIPSRAEPSKERPEVTTTPQVKVGPSKPVKVPPSFDEDDEEETLPPLASKTSLRTLQPPKGPSRAQQPITADEPPVGTGDLLVQHSMELLTMGPTPQPFPVRRDGVVEVDPTALAMAEDLLGLVPSSAAQDEAEDMEATSAVSRPPPPPPPAVREAKSPASKEPPKSVETPPAARPEPSPPSAPSSAEPAELEPGQLTLLLQTALDFLKRRWPWALAAAGAFLLLVLLLVLLVVFVGGGDDEGESVEPEPEAVIVEPPPTVATGALLIDARPWGTVLSIRDKDGQQWLKQEVPSTPARLELPVGTYEVLLARQELEGPFLCRASIREEGLSRCDVTFREPAADDYFKAVGWYE